MQVELGQFGGVLDAPFGNRENTWTERAGVLLRVRDRAGLMGLGEASPLPGYSPDTLADCLDALADVALPDDLDVADVREVAEQVPATAPAARFAIETALLDLLGKRGGVPVSMLLPPLARGRESSRAPVPLNAVCGSVAEADAAFARGIRSLKIKVGRPGALDDEVALLAALRARFGAAVTLRADANRAWTAAEAASALDALAPFDLEYVEEPVVGGACLEHPTVPIALDESLADGDWTLGSASVLVLKPTLLGGYYRCLDLARLGRPVVITHLVDGPIALAACAELALAVGGARACGLDRHAGLSAWPLVDVPSITSSHVVPTGAPGLGVTL